MELFFQTVNKDLSIYRPETSDEEKIFLMHKIIELFTEYNPNITFINSYKIINIKELWYSNIPKHKKKHIFMCRKINEYYELPFNIPKNYDLFFETSTDIYNNYLKTIENIKGNLFNLDDIKICKEVIKNIDNILCWSNSSIILNKILENLDKEESKDLQIITYGSPIILPCYYSKYCINIYHEDDWIIELVNSLFKLDIKLLERDVVYTYIINDKKCMFIILSRKHFDKKIEPHQCVQMFF